MKKTTILKYLAICAAVGLVAWLGKRQEKPIVLEFGMFAQSNWEVEDANAYVVIDQAIRKFEKSHPGVKIYYESGIRKADYSEWLSRKVLSGKTPDMFMILPDDLYRYASLDVIENLNQKMEGDGKFKKEYFFKTVLQMGQYRQGQYALPYETVPTLMFVNKTLLEQEGIQVPSADWTWEDLEAISEKVTKDTNGDGVIDQFGTYNYTWKEAAYSNGAELFDADGEKAYFSGDRVGEAVKFVQRLEEQNGGSTVTQDDFDSGRVAFMPLSFSDYRTYKTYPYKIKKYTSFQWDCTRMPAGPTGGNTSEVDTLMMAMSKRSKHQDLAWEFIKLLTADSEIQREVMRMSQGASVLKYVTGSSFAGSVIRQEMDVDERVIDYELLRDVLETGKVKPRFPKYSEAMALAENRIREIYKNEKNVDSALKIFQRDITKFLKE